MTGSGFQNFIVGRGYVQHWVHGTTHWQIEAKYRYSAQAVLTAFNRLIAKRDGVKSARRFAFVSQETDQFDAQGEGQQAFFDAVHDFYQTYYSTLSELNGLVTRFRHVLGEVPHSGNEKFLNWLEPMALGGEKTMSLLRRAREYRTFLDHPAQHQPYSWAIVETDDGAASIALHGAAGKSGNIPAASKQVASLRGLVGFIPSTSDWVVIAPDEEKVLTALAVQLNTLFPKLNEALSDSEAVRRCNWELILGPEDPQEGYPILASDDGFVAAIKRNDRPGASFGL